MSLLYIGTPPHSKRCSKCRQYKRFNEYAKGPMKYGTQSRCRTCFNACQNKYKNKESRFWKTFHAKTERVGACVEWQGRYSNKVPSIHYEGHAVSLRRIVYRLAIGELSDDQFVVPTCRNWRCVRQSHMACLSNEEFYAYHAHKYPAMGDASPARLHPEKYPRGDRHGARLHPERHARGRSVTGAKLKESDIPVIFALADEGKSHPKIAECFGVSSTTIRMVLIRKTWAHVPIQESL